MAHLDDTSDYVNTVLDDASLKKAQKELSEDPKNRMGAVETLRKWIDEQKHLKFTKDTHILLAYLRYAKFSQLKARKAIENFVSFKTEDPKWFDSFDPLDPAVVKLTKAGFAFILPGVDENGCLRAIYRGGSYNPAEWKDNKAAFAKAMLTIFWHNIHDERIQVNGIVYLSDMTGLTFGHQTFWSIDEMKKMMKSWQNTVPARYKAMYQYNCGPIFEAMMTMSRPFMANKLKSRFLMVGSNLEDVYKVFPKEVLPVEYLPDDYKGPNAGTIDEITDRMLNDMRKPENARFLQLVSHADWKMDKGAKDQDVPNASFRKLNID